LYIFKVGILGIHIVNLAQTFSSCLLALVLLLVNC